MSQPIDVTADRFGELGILRYEIPGFDELSVGVKKLLFYLYGAALSGRDIIWDQSYRHNLLIRQTLEQVYRHYTGNRATPVFEAFVAYLKRIWFSNGIHHHYSGHKFTPEFGPDDLARWVAACPRAAFPLSDGQTIEALLAFLTPILFDPEVDAKKVEKAEGFDLVASSAVNYYENVTQAEVEAFYAERIDPDEEAPVSHGLNSTLVKRNGRITEDIWKLDGKYGHAIESIVYWLEKAVTVAENDDQAEVLERLIRFYRTGDLRDFDEYSIAWVGETEGTVDMIHGFIEVYNDPMGYRGAFEAIVSVKDPIATERIETIARHAQWFEDNAPLEPAHKKESVKGITGSVINVVVESGDSSPATPIGVNLPNADWIRERHGSKSVNLANIVAAYNRARGTLLEAFCRPGAELERALAHLELSEDLHTDLHEVIGHASGKLLPGVGTPKETLKSYASTLEEARADLVALYYMLDPKLVELGLMSSLEVGRAQYDQFIRNGLMLQLRRLAPGEQLEEDHMRNRQLIARWAFEEGREDRVIERISENEKTYFVINKYERLRELFGHQLREIQRIKSEGDHAAGRDLVERYGVAVDTALHEEVLTRFRALDMPSYYGFINPELVPVMDGGRIRDVRVVYPTDFAEQMPDYGERWSFLT